MRRLALAGLLMLMTAPSWAAVGVGTAYNGSGTTGTTATISSVSCSGSDTALIVATGGATGTQATGVTFGSTNATSITTVEFGGVVLGQLWYVLAPAGTETVTATWGSSQGSGAGVSALCLTGVHQTTPAGTPATGAGTGTAVSGQSVSGNASDDLVVDLVSWSASGGATISADAGTTERTANNPYGGWSMNIGTHASGTSQSPTWTISTSQNWSQIVVNIAASAGAGPATHFFGRRVQ